MRAVNALMAFLVEIAALLAYAGWAWTRFDSHFPAAIAAPACAGSLALLWAILAAPGSRHRLARPWLLVFKIAVFAGATATLCDAVSPMAASFFAVVAACHLALAARLGVL